MKKVKGLFDYYKNVNESFIRPSLLCFSKGIDHVLWYIISLSLCSGEKKDKLLSISINKCLRFNVIKYW